MEPVWHFLVLEGMKSLWIFSLLNIQKSPTSCELDSKRGIQLKKWYLKQLYEGLQKLLLKKQFPGKDRDILSFFETKPFLGFVLPFFFFFLIVIDLDEH